jgi:hypothetical protein
VSAAVLGAVEAASAQTRAFLEAPRVRSEIVVQWDPVAKKMFYAVDSDTTFRELRGDALFLASRSIYVTYARPNPLRLLASASVVAADDPSGGIIGRLLEAIVSTVGVVRPEISAAGGGAAATRSPSWLQTCPQYEALLNHQNRLLTLLYPTQLQPVDLQRAVDDWVGAIDTGYGTSGTGGAAVGAGVKLMSTFVGALENSIAAGEKEIVFVEAEATPAPAANDNDCVKETRGLAQTILLTNPRGRVAQIRRIRSTVSELAEALRTQYVQADGKWSGPLGQRFNYRISTEVTPTAAQLQNVTVKATTIGLRVDTVTSGLSVNREDAGSAALAVRRYSALAPEVAVGAVFGFLTQPKYGTAQNAAGQTVVARVPNGEVAITPGLMVNFACRCGAGPFVAPMFQLGTSIAKDTPALLVGGGIRLFGAGPGDVGLAGGALIGWVKDLQELSEGDVITGTKDIEADLGFDQKPQVKGYFTIQYKF